jgi:tetratricopeptide (TPR) repeat protein
VRAWARWRVAAALGAVAIAVGGLALVYRLRAPATTNTVAPHAALTSSPGYDAYLRGRVRVSSENVDDNDAAIRALREAIAADALLAPAHAALARAYTIKAFYFAPDSERKRLNEDAEVEVAKALALDSTSAEAYFARGLLLWTPGQRFPHEQAVRAYKQALAINPRLDEAHHQLALVYMHVGLLDEAQAQLDTALAINPGNTLARFRYGVIDLYRNEYERAYTIFNSTPLEKNPPLWAFQMAIALSRIGRERDAAELIDKFLREYPKDEGGVGTSVRAMMLAKAGRRQEAEAAIARTIAVGRTFGHFHHSAYNIASAYAMLGERAQAIQWLQTAADDGFPCYPLFATDTQLDGLRSDPSFIAMMRKLEADWKERKRSTTATRISKQ